MERVFRGSIVALLAGLVLTASASAASRAYSPNTVIVKYAERPSPAKRLLGGVLGAKVDNVLGAAKLDGVLETVGRIAGSGAQLVRVTGDPAKVAARLNRSRGVLYAEPNYIYRTRGIPNDPLFGQQYGLNNTGQNGAVAGADIDAPEGWDNAFGPGAFPTALDGAKIGIVDTGVDAGHEDLAGKVVDCAGVRSFGIILGLLADPTVVGGRCADQNGHGTHVAGAAAAWANNGRGIAGVAFNSPLSVCRALDARGGGSIAGIANCIFYLANSGAKVISMSIGGPASTTLMNAIAAASQSALLIASAGNSGASVLNFPAAYPQVVSVAAVDASGRRAGFSTFNDDVEVAAPGVDVLSTWNDGGYKAISGTSMATPIVAGVAAIIAGRTAGGPAAWRQKLDASVDGSGARSPELGYGRVSLAKATAP